MTASILDRDVYGAFCRHTHVSLPATGHGPLDGLTFGLKDLFDVAGHRTGFGSPDWLRTHAPATEHATVLTQLLAAGATLAGRTHTEEMAFSLTGENAHYGTPINPAAPERVPGGSSSGSASAVAAGLVDFAIGSDTGGSVRAPASFCGLFGMRPTHGRISLRGACPLAPMYDTVGWFARSAGLLARVGQVLLATDRRPALLPRRVWLATDALALASPEAQAVLHPSLARVQRILGPAEPLTLAAAGLASWYEVFRVLQFADIRRTHEEWIQSFNPTFGPQVGARFAAVLQTDATEVEHRRSDAAAIRDQLHHLLEGDAVLLMPTVPDVAPRRGLPAAETVRVRERMLALLCPAGLAGLPQVSLPLAQVGGLPLGVSLIGAPGSDEWLLHLAERVATDD